MKKIISTVLAILIIISVIPITSFAAENSNPQATITTATDNAQTAITAWGEYNGKDISLKWSTDDNTTKYGIFVLNIDSDEFELVSETEQSNFTLNSVQANTTYQILIKYFDGENWNEENKSNIITISTNQNITSLKATVFANTVALSWNKVNDNSKYNIYTYNSSTKKYKLLTTTTSNTYKVNSLSYNSKYIYAVSIKYDNAESKLYNITATTALKVPKVTLYASGTTINISWGKVSGASTYRIYRYDTSNKSYSRIAITTKTSYSQTKLKTGTKYTYLVRACSSANNLSSYTTANNVSVYTIPNKPEIILAVGGIRACNISWEPSAGATSYNIYRYDFSKGFIKIANTKDTAYTAKVAGQTDGCAWTYIFLVRAVNNAGSSSYSFNADRLVITSEISRDIVITDEALLANCKADYLKRTGYPLSADREKIIKTAISIRNRVPYYMGGGHGIGYTLNKGMNNPWNKIGATSYSSDNTYRILGLDCSGYVHWTYWTALNYKGLNGLTYSQIKNSNTISASSLLPGDLAFTDSVDHVGIYLYTDSSGNKIYIHSNGGSQNISVSALTSFTVFRKAKNLSDKRKTSTSTNKPKALPSAPKLTVKGGINTVSLSWNKVNGATKYGVWLYSTSNKKYSFIGNCTSTSYTHKNRKNGTKYYYLVRAYNKDGYSNFSIKNVVGATTSKKGGPTVSISGGDEKIVLKWSKIDGAKYYRIYRYSNGKYTKVADTKKLNYTVSKLSVNTQYTYLIRAKKTFTWTDYTANNRVSATTTAYRLTSEQKKWANSKLSYLSDKYNILFDGEIKPCSGGKFLSNLIRRDYKFTLGSYYMEDYFKAKKADGYNNLSYYYTENTYGSKLYLVWNK